MKQKCWNCKCGNATSLRDPTAGIVTVWASYFADTKEEAAARFATDYEALAPVEIVEYEYQ